MNPPFAQGFDLSGKIAVVTGGASGIGWAIAELFAAQGAQLALLDLGDSVQGALERLPGGRERHLALQTDLSSLESLGGAVSEVLERFSRVDILVNNAGVALLEEATSLSEAQWDATLNINLKAPFFLAQALGHGMIAQGYGRIVNLASQASVIALERHAAYCASKAGLVSLTQVLAAEWAQHGITVNAISPTVVETELGKKAWAGEVGEAMKRKIPLGRFGRPEEIAALALYLVSEHAGLMTGENIVIDGGYTIV